MLGMKIHAKWALPHIGLKSQVLQIGDFSIISPIFDIGLIFKGTLQAA